jgi:hypothetical protein
MNSSLKMAALAAFFSAAALPSQAQTNLVESLGFQLVVFSQGVPVTNGAEVIQNADVTRLGTRDVIKVLGAATTNDFSGSAELLRVTAIIDGTNGATSTIVKDGTNVVDVTDFFSTSRDGVVVRNSTARHDNIQDSTSYSIRRLALRDQAGYPDLTTSFALQGFDILNFRRAELKDGLVVDGRYATWSVNGTGDQYGKPIIINGEITVNFVEVAVGPGL